MPKNPMIHALATSAYIVGLVLFVDNVLVRPDTEDTSFAPIIMLSLFVLSAAVMGYLFLGEPIQRYLDGDKKSSVKFFFQTVGAFAVTTALIISIFVFFGR